MSAKKIDFKKIALIGGGLWIGNKLLTKDPATVQAFSAASLGGGNVSDIEALKTLIKTDPQIRALLKGDTGAEGTPGGPTGPKGADGLNAPNFGGSLLRNGAFENGTENWPSGIVQDGTLEGMPVYKFTTLSAANNKNTAHFRVNTDRLIEVSFQSKQNVSLSLFLERYDNNLNKILVSGTANIYGLSSTTKAADSNFSKSTFYFGGKDNSQTYRIGSNAAFCQVNFFVGSAGEFSLSRVVVKEVDLGQPVPYTLSYLPAGQMVYDPATGDVGRWDGTAVTWFAVAP